MAFESGVSAIPVVFTFDRSPRSMCSWCYACIDGEMAGVGKPVDARDFHEHRDRGAATDTRQRHQDRPVRMLAQFGFELFRELGACTPHLEQMSRKRTNDEVRLVRTRHGHRLLTERVDNLIGDLLP